MTKGTILYIGGFELPDKNAAAHRVINNAKAFRDVGYDVVFLGIHKNSGDEVLCDEIMGFKAYSLPYPKGALEWLKFVTSWNVYIEPLSEIQGVSHICLYNFPAISMYRALQFCRSNGIKIISDCSEWYQPSYSEGYVRGLIKWADVQLRMRWTNRLVDSVICISKFLLNYYRSFNQAAVYVPPLVDLADDKWRQRSDLVVRRENGVSFFYAGSPFSLGSGNKKDIAKDRLDIILSAFAKVKAKNPDFKFIFNIYGLTESDFLNYYPDYNSKLLDLTGYFVFHGKCSHTDVMAALSCSDFMVFYRDDCLVTKAGFPTKFVEAFSAGVPVITNINSNVSDYLENGVNGFLDEGFEIDSYVSVLERALAISENNMVVMKDNSISRRGVFHYERHLESFKKILD